MSDNNEESTQPVEQVEGAEQTPAKEEPSLEEMARAEYGLPAEWDHDTIKAWINLGGDKVGKTEAGILRIDPTRTEDNLDDQPTDVLVAAVRGELEDLNDTQLAKLIAILRTRFKELDLAWSDKECQNFIVQDIVPDKTTKGAWVNDITRKMRNAPSWTTQELESWALGEIKPEGTTTEARLALELRKRMSLKVASDSIEDIIKAYRFRTQPKDVAQPKGEVPTVQTQPVEVAAVIQKQAREGLTEMNQTYIESTLARYHEMVRPGLGVTEATGAQAQRALDTLIRYIVGIEDPVGFKNAMDMFREFFNKHREGLFSDTNMYRFTDTLRSDNNVRESHVRLLALFGIFADADKEARTQYDIPFLVSMFPVDKQPLLLAYFNDVK